MNSAVCKKDRHLSSVSLSSIFIYFGVQNQVPTTNGLTPCRSMSTNTIDLAARRIQGIISGKLCQYERQN